MSVKFLGAGEPFQNKRFLEFLRELKKMDIIPLIFTKGHVIGDDDEVRRWYSHYGIFTGEQLVQELKKVNASILLGFNSFNSNLQDKMVGGIKGYISKRNRALNLLTKAGFNSKKNSPTKLALIATPITSDNLNEIFKIYRWGRLRNILVVTCPTMVSGRCGDNQWKKITPDIQDLVDLYTKIYQWNVKKRLQTSEQIQKEGISSYAGAHPCNQVACGMYVTLSGKVLRCPGDDITVFGSVFEKSLEEIWKNSENYKRSGQFNCGCPPKAGKSIPCSLFSSVMQNIKQY